jgi:hypothetical protein
MLRSITSMLVNMDVYQSLFEPHFLSASEFRYSAEGVEMVGQLSVSLLANVTPESATSEHSLALL